MKIFRISVMTIMAVGFIACGGSDEAEESLENLTESLNDLSDELDNLNPEGWTSQTDGEFFDIDIPNHMKEMPELNTEASLTYGYIEQVGVIVKENYLIVIAESLDSIATYDLDFKFDAASYSDLSVESMTAGLATFENLTPDAEVQEINGMDCVITEIEGSMQVADGSSVNVFYMMAIYEGEEAFYQVLSWTIGDQKAEFKEDMEKMIMSFIEK